MSDDVKKALEWLRGIVRTAKQEGDLFTHAEPLLAHIDAEPERLAAAVAREREEQREADVRSCPTCKGEGFMMRVRECPFCNDSTHDHECPTDLVKWPCLCGAARIRAMPLDSTPLGDELAQVRRERDALKVRALGAEARVMELEEEQEARDDVMTAEQRLKFWEENPHACPVHFGARTACGQCHDSTAQQLTNLRIEHEAVVNEVETAEARVKELEALGDQSRASCPKTDHVSEGDDETDIIIAGRQVPFVQVGMIVHPDDCLNCERDGSPLWCSALVCDIHDDDETARFGMMATLLFRNGERREEPCDELRRRWRLARDFDQSRVYTGRWGAIPRGSVWPVTEVNEDA